jgi:hypothetical protein
MERMSQYAFLAPVGPFPGLSNSARQKIAERFPALSLAEVERVAESFSTDLQAANVDSRLAEARDELNVFARELARFRTAVNRARKRRLDRVVGEASRSIGGENEFSKLDHSLGRVGTAVRRTARMLPYGTAELASRRLVEALARHAGLAVGSARNDSLATLVDLIFDDLMVGGDAAGAVREWRQSRTAENEEESGLLLDIVS